jgi:ketol-acid reductoisomerase
MRPLFQKHMDDIISGEFSKNMMIDWANDDVNLLTWRAATGAPTSKNSNNSFTYFRARYFDNGVLMIAGKARVELALKP